MMERLLVVDDEEDICEILQYNLESEGYKVDVAYSAEEALKKLMPDHRLILLDVMMDKMSGFQMANILRHEQHNNIPIIFLTAKNTENDILTGFNIGADDYISKPFSLKEVLARVKAVLKRNSSDTAEKQPSGRIEEGGLVIDTSASTVTLDGDTVDLTKKEYGILVLLAQNAGTFYARETILERVWEKDVYVLDRSVDVHVARLRKKLGRAGSLIVNKAGFGYCFKTESR